MSPSTISASKSAPKPSWNQYRMTSSLKNLYYRLTPSNSSTSIPTTKNIGNFSKAKAADTLFPVTNAEEDGEDCLHDCATCTIKYPNKFTIDEEEMLYGHVKGWSTHMIVATGKTDWVRDVADEKGSIMEAVDRSGIKPSNGRLMLSASNMPLPDHSHDDPSSTTVLLLPSFNLVEKVTPASVPDLITHHVNTGPTNTSPLSSSQPSKATSPLSAPPSLPPSESSSADPATIETTIPPAPSTTSTLKTRPCPHQYLILLCSQKTRDARCGQSAPLLRREFERHLRPLGLYRDLHDERPGGVGIYFISHVGGHKFSANVMVYRRQDVKSLNLNTEEESNGIETDVEKLQVEDSNKEEAERKTEAVMGLGGEAAQCIWLARVRPEDCENIIKYTVLQGKVVKPDRQLRGGFDRGKGLVSW